MKNIVIFDLDGCLIDDSHRVPLIDWKNRNFEDYHAPEQMEKDTALPLGSILLQEAKSREDHIVFFTARPEKVRNVTISQIKTFFDINILSGDADLLMRADDQEGIPSAELKRRMYIYYLGQMKKQFQYVYAFDDHPDVVMMYQELGVKSTLVSKYIVCDGVMEPALINIRRGKAFSYKGTKAGIELDGYQGYHNFILLLEAKTNSYVNSLITILDMASSEMITVSDYYTRAAIRPVATEPDDVLESVRAQQPTCRIAADVLEEAAATFRERNALYKDNALVVGKVMTALFPNGVELKTPEDYHMWHLFELLIVKLTRFTNSGLTHQDSILDLTVYAAMLEPLINTHKIKTK